MKEIEKVLKRKSTKSVATGLLEHKRVLAQDTPKSLIKKNSQFVNKYIPLEHVEFMLNCLFTHHEVVIPFAPTYLEGQVLWVVNLIVHHPVTGEKLTYSGNACVPLISADKENHKYNHRNVPAGESFAIMNASKKIGNIFNPERDNHVDVMKDYFEKKKNDSDKDSVEVDRMKKVIDACKDLDSLENLFGKMLRLGDVVLEEYYFAKKQLLKK